MMAKVTQLLGNLKVALHSAPLVCANEGDLSTLIPDQYLSLARKMWQHVTDPDMPAPVYYQFAYNGDLNYGFFRDTREGQVYIAETSKDGKVSRIFEIPMDVCLLLDEDVCVSDEHSVSVGLATY